MVDIFAKEGIEYKKPENSASIPPITNDDLNAPQPTSNVKVAPVRLKTGPVDIFQSEGITVPSIDERNTNAVMSGFELDNPQTEDQKIVADNVKSNLSDMEVLAATRFTPEQISNFKNNPIGWRDAGKFLNFQNTLPGGGLYQAFDIYMATTAAKKIERGEELTVNEEDALNKMVDTYLEQSLRGWTLGGSVRYGVSTMPAFAIEFIASGGVGKLAEKAAIEGVQKIATKSAVTAAAAKVTGVTANIAARTAVMPTMYAPKYAERRFNDSVAITDKGELFFKQSEESPAKSALMAFGYSSAEVASEMAGGAVGKYVLDPVRGVLKTPLIAAVNKLPVSVRSSIYEAYKKINPNAQVSKVFTAAGWNGMLEELGEERVGDILRSTLALAANDKQAASDGDYDFGDFMDGITPTADQLLVEAGIISIAQGVKTSGDLTFNLLKSKGVSPSDANMIVDNMSANEQEQFVAKNLAEPVSGFVPNVETDALIIGERSSLSDGVLRAPITTQDGADTGFVEYKIEGENLEIYGMKLGENPNSYSVRHIRTLVSQIKRDHPEVKTVSGHRITAGRGIDGQMVSVKLQDAIDQTPTQEIVSGTPELNVSEQDAIADGAPPSPVMFEGDVSQGQIASVEKGDPPKIIDDESMANRWYREWLNELDPIQKLPDIARQRGAHVGDMQDTKLLSATYSGILGQIRQNLQVGTFKKDENGNNVITGKSLKATLDDFDNVFIATESRRAKREQDFSDYLVAQRYIEDLNNRSDVEVTEEQKAKSVSDMNYLAKKYGNDFHFFEVFAQEVYDFQRRILQNLVDSGVMSKDSYNEIITKNPNYVPFQRVLDDETYAGNVSTTGVFTDANANRIIKRITGSDKEIKNVFHSIIKNTAKIIDMSARNEVAKSIANLSDVMPEYIQPIAAPMVKRGTAKVKVTYDKRLREKLEATIKMFGEEFEQKKTLGKPGQRGFVRGDYSPDEKLVRLRLGSSDAVLTHEVGHMLDFRIGLRKKMLNDPVVKEQLIKLAEQRLSAQTEAIKKGKSVNFEETTTFRESEKHQEYVKNDFEIIANFFDAYVNAPDLLNKIAPKAKEKFDAIIDGYEELAFIKQIKPSLERAEEEVEQDVWGPADYAPAGTITVRRDGKKEYYRVSKPILEAIESLNPSKLNIIEKLFTASASVLRAGATLVPEFWIRNVLRDQQTALLQSGVKYRPQDFARGLMAVIFKSDLYNEWERSGGSFNSYMDLNDKGLEKAYEELFRPGGRMWRYLNPINIAADISGSLEQATRVGVFGRAKIEGQSDIQSALTSRDATLDFSRRGSVGKRLNRVLPFFNAGLQGSNKLVRTFRSNPGAATFWGLATITVPSVLITGWYLYGAPDDERKEYLEIPEWQKDMFWIVKVGDEWKRYPKPFSYGYIFGSLPERMMMWGYQGNKPEGKAAWQDMAMGLAGSFSPVYDPAALIPPLAKVYLEDVTNYNFFTGRSVYPDWMEKLDPEFQSQKYTSETAKFLGSQLDMSPAKIDNALRGQLAGSADYLTGAGDRIIKQVKEWNGEDVPEEPRTASDIAVLKAFAVRRPAGYRSQSAKYFFENFDEAQKKHNSANQLDGQKKKEYLEKHRVVLSQYAPLNSAFKGMKDLQKQVDAVYENATMTAETKVKKINMLEDKITEIARQANNNYNKITRDSK